MLQYVCLPCRMNISAGKFIDDCCRSKVSLQVDSFCDDEDYNSNSVHNYEAPSRHNRLCSGKSSWAIMRNSPDFRNGMFDMMRRY